MYVSKEALRHVYEINVYLSFMIKPKKINVLYLLNI